MAILDGKVIVVTGSSRGLGLAIGQACAAAGAAVVLSSRSAEATGRAVDAVRASGAQAVGQACDVADLAEVEALAELAVQSFGHFDVWVNNAGQSAPYGPSAHVPRGDFVRVIETNITGTYYGSSVALRYFYPRGTGKLINILGRGDTGAVPLQNAYTSSKTWVRSFTKVLAQEYKDSGIGIFAYNPGLMTTEFLTGAQALAGFEGRMRPLETVMRMWGNPPAVPALKVVWLASAATDGKTGLELHELGPLQMLGGALREGLRLLRRKPAPASGMHITTVTPAMPLRTDAGSIPGLPELDAFGGANDEASGRASRTK